MNENVLWEAVRICFHEDDGSLPTIEVEPLRISEIELIFEMLIREGEVTSDDPVFYDQQIDKLLPITSVPNAAKLVAKSEASPFHMAFEGICCNGQELPELGFFFFQDCIAVDYRMGQTWNSAKVFAFFVWLKDFLSLTESAKVKASSSEGPPSPEIFNAAWQEFLSGGL